MSIEAGRTGEVVTSAVRVRLIETRVHAVVATKHGVVGSIIGKAQIEYHPIEARASGLF